MAGKSPHFAPFTSELGWKIFLDRYTVKDSLRAFQPGDLVITVTEPDPRWPKKEIGRVESVDEQDQVTMTLLTGPNTDTSFVQSARLCDRPSEQSLSEVSSRIAQGIAAVEADDVRDAVTESFFTEMQTLRLIPGGRIWAGAGTDQHVTYYNCYVIPNPQDSRHGIVQTLDRMIEIMSRGGGVGINISSLRPYRSYVKGVNGRSSGAVSWMDLYSRATGLVEQGGSRRGALMLQIEDWHPDLSRFIEIKKTPGMVENANISVRISDRFMDAVKNNEEWSLVFPDLDDPEYDTVWTGDLNAWQAMGKGVVVYETKPAKEYWDAIIAGAWQAAEPGIIFAERQEKESNSWYFNPLNCTNPCAEQPLPAWGVCTLGHVNLAAMYDPDVQDIAWEQLRKTVHVGVRFLDNVVDATPYYFEENRINQVNERRIGLGTMGLGELLIRLGLRYGSPASLKFIEKLFKFIAVEAYKASVELAKEKGSFPAFDAEKYLQSGFIKRMPKTVRDAVKQFGIRNVTLLTQAPTGTVGTMVGTSTGIEPFFALSYKRQSRLGLDTQYVDVAREWLDANPGEDLPDYFVGAMDLTPEQHVQVQAAIQKWTDSSISKTANAPSTYTLEDTAKLYELAYDLGCKGVTIYRDLSRSEQVLHLIDEPEGSSGSASSRSVPQITEPDIAERPKRMRGRAYTVKAHFGSMTVDIHETEPGIPFEVFVNVGAVGSDLLADAVGIGRTISMMLRLNSPVSRFKRLQTMIEMLKNIGGAGSYGFGASRITSLPSAIAQALTLYVDDMAAEWEETDDVMLLPETEPPTSVVPETSIPLPVTSYDLCPMCGTYGLVNQEGCSKCVSCGYSKC